MATESHEPEDRRIDSDWTGVANVHRFAHGAMAAVFEIIVQHEDDVYARQAAQAAFDLLDRLEADLSRYIESSDVTRINHLAAGEPLLVGLETFECLELSRRVSVETDGAFDVTAGLLVDCWRDKNKKPRTPSEEELAFARAHTGMSLLNLDASRFTVELSAGGVRVDLGGVGKGFGVDKMAQLLGEWSIDRALLNGGYSTVLALKPPEGALGWPVTLSDPRDRRRKLARLTLQHGAVAGSGLKKGPHIIDPRTGKPVEGTLAAWSVAPDAGTADALSTAFTIMTPQEVTDFCAAHEHTRALLVVPNADGSERLVAAGPWAQGELVY